MALFDAKPLNKEIDGAELLASVLFPTPEARADALARGRARLARAGTFAEAMTVPGASNRGGCSGRRAASVA